MALTDYKASEIFSGFDISSLSDRPNEDGITSTQLKARFDYLIKNMIPLHNSLINALIVLLENGNETNGHKHNVDNLIDGTTNRLFTETLKLKLDGIQAQAEVNQNAFSNIKVGATTGNADSKTATFEIVAGSNIIASIDPLTNKVTLSATGDISTLAVQSILDDIGNYYNSIEVNGALQEIGASLYPSLSKTTPVDADTLLVVDSQASSIFKKLSWANIKATLKTYFDTVYFNYTHPTGDGNLHVPANSTSNNNKVLKANSTAGSYSWTDLGTVANGLTAKATPINADSIMIVDSAASNVGKKTTFTQLKAFLKTYFDTVYQGILVSGTNIKTINGNSILGIGDVELLPKNNPTATGTQTFPSIVTNGIKFPATQVPSADPNTLDDYEEGTFTPVIVGDGVAGVGTYIYQFGRYTKVGNVVNFVINIATSAHTGTGNMIINGLPFTQASVQWLGTPCLIASAVLSYVNQLVAVVIASSVIPYTISNGGGETKIPVDQTCYLSISGTYHTT